MIFSVHILVVDKEEATVIIGAHTLGRTHKSGSGFDGQWTTDTFSFNNDYFIQLLDKSNQWDQTVPQQSGFPEWSNMGRGPNQQELRMLNVDMS